MKRSDRSKAKEAARLAMLERIAAERLLEAQHGFTCRRLEADEARLIFKPINSKPVFAPMRLKAVPARAASTYRGHHRNATRDQRFNDRRAERWVCWHSRGMQPMRAAA